jgi:hypothetical protein
VSGTWTGSAEPQDTGSVDLAHSFVIGIWLLQHALGFTTAMV